MQLAGGGVQLGHCISCPPTRSPKRAAASLGVIVVLLGGAQLGLAGCTHGPSAAEMRGARYVVRDVDFEGVERFEDREIDQYLELQPRRVLPPERHWYYEGLIPGDAERIVELYHAYGYYEAKVVDVRVEVLDRRRDAVDLVYVIEEGPVTRVDEVVVRWPEGPPPGPSRRERGGPFARGPAIDPETVSRQVKIAVGDPFEIEAFNASAAALRNYLQQAGHPYAEVNEHAEVDRERRTASVEFEVIPGPFMRIGAIAVTGLATVPDKAVSVELESAIGKPYSPRLIERVEQQAYGLGVFSTVTVRTKPAAKPEQADESQDSGSGTVDLEVAVHEGDPQRVRLGVSLGFEPNRWDQRFSARYSHHNLFRNLYRLRLTGGAGYAELPNAFNPVAHGPVAKLELYVEKKGLLEKYLVWTLEPRIELGIEQGYQFWTTEHRFGVSRFFTRWFQLRLSHNLRYVDFFAISPTLDVTNTMLGLDFRDPYIISYIEIGATIFAVDRITAPHNGAVLEVDYRVAGGPFGGQHDFQEVAPVLRGYWRPIERLQLAVRARVGMIFPFGDQPGAPIDMRRYLGGTDTVRGWGLKRLAPRIDDCGPNQDYRKGECDSIPVGGNTSVLGNFEIRVRAWKKLWVAAFVDAGDVQPGVRQFVPKEWNYSSGGGLRYDSPIGKFRLDVGVRLNDTPLSAGEPIWAIHLGLGESF